MRRAMIAVTALATCLLAACGSSSGATSPTAPSTSAATTSDASSAPAPSSSSSSSPAPMTTSAAKPAAVGVAIMIKDYEFGVSGSAAPGDNVRVTNSDNTTHSVTANSAGGFDVTVRPGKTVTFTAPGKAGRYKFHCMFHSEMHGSLTVAG